MSWARGLRGFVCPVWLWLARPVPQLWQQVPAQEYGRRQAQRQQQQEHQGLKWVSGLPLPAGRVGMMRAACFSELLKLNQACYTCLSWQAPF